MARKVQESSDTYDPDTLNLLARAFDAAWGDISNGKAATEAEDRRNHLALIILSIARGGARDEVNIKETAVHIMKTEEFLHRNAVRRGLV